MDPRAELNVRPDLRARADRYTGADPDRADDLRRGMNVGEVRLSYADQYVQAWACHPDAPPETEEGCGANRHELDTPEAVVNAAAFFRKQCEQSLRAWHERLEGWRAAGDRIALWGSGSKATGFLTTLGIGELVDAVVDINPAKHGKFVAGTGHCIVAPEKLVELRPQRVVVMNPIYRDEIGAGLRELGVEAEVSAL